ncbi:MAG: PDZ domain-containing protein [Planctomycetaceae bacterium]|nr:PDZ domain-containing protein [Planctomycetaceae bacterium]
MGLLLGLLTPSSASAQVMGLKPRLYTTGSTLRRAFSEVIAHARVSTVQIYSGNQVVALGVIVAEDGWILTKASELGQKVSCRLADGESFDATIVGTHEATDLALLKIDAADLTPIEWEISDPAVGQWVVTPGVREVPEAIGVVGVGRRKIDLERESGVLGVQLQGETGAPRVAHVFPNSGAEMAGLKVGDLIEKIDGVTLTGRQSMINRIHKRNPGDAIKLSVLRDEEELEVEATLTSREISNEFLSRIAVQNRMGGDLSSRRTGFEAVIQHDSVLRPEECGGPAIGLSGKAFGINIARAGRTETYALPADLVRPVIDELKLQAPSSVVSKE